MNEIIPDPVEAVIFVGAVRALRNRADMQRSTASASTSSAGDKYPHVALRSPEAACAETQARAWAAIARRAAIARFPNGRAAKLTAARLKAWETRRARSLDRKDGES
jgi:hypothetical protein